MKEFAHFIKELEVVLFSDLTPDPEWTPDSNKRQLPKKVLIIWAGLINLFS